MDHDKFDIVFCHLLDCPFAPTMQLLQHMLVVESERLSLAARQHHMDAV